MQVYNKRMVFGIILGIGIMGGIIYMAVSKKSSFQVRIAALGALALMIVSVIICFVLYFKAASVPKAPLLPDMMGSEMPPPANNSPVTLIMLSVFLIVLFAIIFFMALREQKRAEGKEEKPGNDW